MGKIQLDDHVWIEKRDLVCCACRMELYAEMVGETDSKCCCSCHINTFAGNGLQENRRPEPELVGNPIPTEIQVS
jgi:hypothetical protein